MTDDITISVEFSDAFWVLYNEFSYRTLRFEMTIGHYLEDVHLSFTTTFLETYDKETELLRAILKNRGIGVVSVEKQLWENTRTGDGDEDIQGIKVILNLDARHALTFDPLAIWQAFIDELRRRGASTNYEYFRNDLVHWSRTHVEDNNNLYDPSFRDRVASQANSNLALGLKSLRKKTDGVFVPLTESDAQLLKEGTGDLGTPMRVVTLSEEERTSVGFRAWVLQDRIRARQQRHEVESTRLGESDRGE